MIEAPFSDSTEPVEVKLWGIFDVRYSQFLVLLELSWRKGFNGFAK
jgi:hypothetical protein